MKKDEKASSKETEGEWKDEWNSSEEDADESGSSDDDVGLPNNKINSRPDLPFDLPASHGGASGTSVNKPPPQPPAAEDDEAFARRLQEEENARYQAER